MEYGEGKLTAVIISSIIKVHQTLGPGFLGVYRRALLRELRLRDLNVDTEKKIYIYYEGEEVGQHKLDILVENLVIVELKTVEDLSRAHYAQVRSYLKATDLKLAILVNFAKERADYRRVERESTIYPPISPISTSPFLHQDKETP